MNRRQEWPFDRDVSPFEGPDERWLDRLFAALSKVRRPHVLQRLTKTLGPLTVWELAGRVAQDGRNSNTVEPTVESVGREHPSLYQVDLSKLVKAGHVVPDPEASGVCLRDPERYPDLKCIVELIMTWRTASNRP